MLVFPSPRNKMYSVWVQLLECACTRAVLSYGIQCPSATWWMCTNAVILPLSLCLLPSLFSMSILTCWWLFSRVDRAVVFCLVFREAASPCSSLFILTLFKLALLSPRWVFLFLCLFFLFFTRVPFPVHLCGCYIQSAESSTLWSHCLVGLWQIKMAVFDHGCFCILLGVSASFYVSASSLPLSLPISLALCLN